ncbi:MAG TPA: FAD-dependent oxidoreductase, partial [Thermoanaerobaculia bacterium]
MRTREERLAELERSRFDVLVVGGGITGAAVARDAASRGLSVALVEKSDWGSGTSWRSTKLVHGGLRYLRQGEIRLVFESLSERARLLELAPHLV